MKPSTTVVIASLNSARTIAATLQTICYQTEPPAEVIVVDDNSDDDSRRAAEDFSERLPIVVLKKDGQRGLWSSRNQGVEWASTPLVTFVDADDLLMPNHIEAHLRLAETGTIVDSGVMDWYPESGAVVTRPRRMPDTNEQLHAVLRSNYLTSVCTISKADFEAIGGYRPVVTEDWDLWIRALTLGLKVVRTCEYTYIYRRQEHSLSLDASIFERNIECLDRARKEVRPEFARDIARGIRRQRSLQEVHRLRETLQAEGGVSTGRILQTVKAVDWRTAWELTRNKWCRTCTTRGATGPPRC